MAGNTVRKSYRQEALGFKINVGFHNGPQVIE